MSILLYDYFCNLFQVSFTFCCYLRLRLGLGQIKKILTAFPVPHVSHTLTSSGALFIISRRAGSLQAEMLHFKQFGVELIKCTFYEPALSILPLYIFFL